MKYVYGALALGVLVAVVSMFTFKEGNTAPIEVQRYKDGEYVVTVDYNIPYEFVEPMDVSITLEGDTVSSTSVTFATVNPVSSDYQAGFANIYKTKVLNRNIDEIEIARLGGASLTTGAYNAAIEKVKALAVE